MNERLPSEIVFNFRWAEPPQSGSNISLELGKLVIRELNFEGGREVGNEFAFRFADPSGVPVDMQSTEVNPALRYNVPAGVYNRIRVSFDLLSKEGEPSIWIEGRYRNSQGNSVPFRLEYSANLLVEALAQHETDISLPFVILESEISNLYITMDPYAWMQLVTERDMNEASISDWSGKSGILISSTENELIYDKIVRRVGQSVQVIYK